MITGISFTLFQKYLFFRDSDVNICDTDSEYESSSLRSTAVNAYTTRYYNLN